MALSRDKRATGDILKKYRPSLKVKMSKSKIYSTIDTQNNLTRTNSSFRIINSKSRNPSQRKIADNSKNFRSMSNLKLAMNKPVTHHNSSMTRCKNSGGRLNIDSISHNRSYGRHYPDTLQ